MPAAEVQQLLLQGGQPRAKAPGARQRREAAVAAQRAALSAAMPADAAVEVEAAVATA